MFAIHTFICIVTYDILVGPETDHFAVLEVDYVIKQVKTQFNQFIQLLRIFTLYYKLIQGVSLEP